MSIREDLKAFVDNELSPARAEEVRLAVEQDPALQQEVQFMKLLSREIKESAAEPEIKGAAEVIEVVRKKPGIFSRYRPAWAIGGIVLIMLLALPYLNPEQQMTASAAPASDANALLSKADSLRGGDGTQSSTPAFSGAAAAKAAAPNPAAGLSFKHATMGMRPGLPGDRAGSFGRSGKASTDTPSTVTSTDSESAGDSLAQSQPAPAPAPAPQILTPESNRKIIQDGNLDVTVDDVQSAQIKATNLTIANGGFVQNSSLDYESHITPAVSLTLRIPAPRFAAVVASIMAYGKVTGSHITGEDVTAQTADVNARLQELGAEEDSYVGMLHNTRHLSDVIQLRDKLSEVRQEIESLHAQSSALKDQSTLSTLNVTFDQKSKNAVKPAAPEEPKDPWAKDTFKSALSGLTTAGRFLGQIIIFLFVYSPLWIPLGGLIWWLNKRKR